MKTILYIFCAIYMSISVLSAQKYIHQQYGLEEGLSDIQCFDVFEDSQGYIWVGTRAGASRFDGKDFVNFDRSNGLLADHIYSFHEDSQGRIWMVNLNGEPLFIKNGQVHNRFSDPYMNDLKSNELWEMMIEDSVGRVWFIGRHQYPQFIKNKTVRSVSFPKEFNPEGHLFLGLFEYKKDIILITSKGIYAFDSEFEILKWEIIWEAEFYTIRRILFNDKIIITPSSDRLEIDLVTKNVKRIEGDNTIAMYADIRELNGSLYFSSAAGVHEFKDEVFAGCNEKFEIGNEEVSAIEIDRNGNIWLATRKNGLILKSKTHVVKSDFSNYKGITYLEKDEENIIEIGHDKNVFTKLDSNQIVEEYAGLGSDIYDIIKTIRIDNDFWIVDKSYIYNPISGEKFTLYKRDLIYNEKIKKLYFTNQEGIYVIDYETLKSSLNEFKGINFNKLDYIIPVYQAYNMCQDTEHNVWVGSEEGLFEVIDTVVVKLDDPNISGSIIDVESQADHLVGINYGKGLFIYNKDTKSSELLSSAAGLPSNNITMMDWKGKDVWVSHSRGVSHIKQTHDKLEIVKNYNHNHGLPRGEITLLKIIDNEPHFVINDLAYKIVDDSVTNDTLDLKLNSEEVTFYKDEDFTINYDCINYTYGADLMYEYRLLPRDTSWVSTENEFSNFQYLPVDDYTFEVRAAHILNLPSRISSKKIFIVDRWYNGWMFKGLLGFLFLGILWFLVRIDALKFSLNILKEWIKKILLSTTEKTIKLKDIQGLQRIFKADKIGYLKASGNYVEYHLDEETFMTRCTMTKTENDLEPYENIMRCHRSYMVNLDKISGIGKSILKIGEEEIPYSTKYKKEIEDYLSDD